METTRSEEELTELVDELRKRINRLLAIKKETSEELQALRLKKEEQ